MQSNLLLTNREGLAQLFNPTWSFTHGTMAVARLLKYADTAGEALFNGYFLVYGNTVVPAKMHVERGPDTTQVIFVDPTEEVPSYIVNYQN